ncbi:MAG: DNA-methyltransferase [Candidatus Sulfotelmatobacter sp.]
MQNIHIPTLVCADARQIPLADATVQCVVTSPPYWQLRHYDGEQDGVWGGSSDCNHQWREEKKIKQTPQRDHARGGGFAKTRGNEAARKGMAFETSQGRFCTVCGAWYGCYGFEPTIQLYVEHTIEILREIRRVLRDDGVLFWNISDTLRDKGLSAVPQRIAIAAIDDGWILRDTIIWAKPNPMPESVKDRLTRSHETILMLAKNPQYYWNTEASREAATSKDAGADGKRNMRNVWTIATQPFRGAHFAPFPEEIPRRCISLASKPGDMILDPFGGSGTTGKVAMELERRSILLDLNYTGNGGYETLARQRTQNFIECHPATNISTSYSDTTFPTCYTDCYDRACAESQVTTS